MSRGIHGIRTTGMIGRMEKIGEIGQCDEVAEQARPYHFPIVSVGVQLK